MIHVANEGDRDFFCKGEATKAEAHHSDQSIHDMLVILGVIAVLPAIRIVDCSS